MLVILVYNFNYITLFISIFYVIFIFIKLSWKSWVFVFSIIGISSFSFITIFFAPQPVFNNTEQYEIVVREVNFNYLIVESKEGKHLFYPDENLENIALNSKYIVSGALRPIKVNSNESQFEFASFLRAKKVYSQLEAEMITYVNDSTSIQLLIKNWINENVGNPEVKNISSLLLFNFRNSENIIFYEQALSFNIVQLLVISGFHISIFVFIFQKALQWILPKWLIASIIFIFLGIYSFILGFTFSIIRASFSWILVFLNSLLPLQYRINKISIISMIFLGFLLFSPELLFTTSYIFSAVVLVSLVFIGKILQNKNKFARFFLTYLILYLITAPILITINYSFAPMSILWNILFTPIIGFLYVLYAVFLFTPINSILTVPTAVLTFLFNFLSTINFEIIIGSLEIWVLFLYFLAVIAGMIFLKSIKKYWRVLPGLAIPYSFLLINPQITTLEQKVVFFDVGHGLSVLISDQINDTNILIDAPGGAYNSSVNNIILPYLNRSRVNKVISDIFYI